MASNQPSFDYVVQKLMGKLYTGRVVADPAGKNSNSYVTPEEADTYIYVKGSHEAGEAWAAMSIADRENLLIETAAIIDVFNYGPKYSSEQAMKFPRLSDVDETGNPYIPVEIKLIQLDLLLLVLEGNYNIWEVLPVKQIESGDLRQVFQGFKLDRLPPGIRDRLRRFVIYTGSIE